MSNQIIVKENIKEDFNNLIQTHNFQSCLIITTSGNKKRNYYSFFSEIMKQNNCNFEIYTQNNYPSLSEIENIYKHYDRNNFDLILSIGGGSVIDISKLYSSCKIENHELLSIDDLIIEDSSNQIFNVAIPTTAGSGAESTKFATVWSFHNKKKLSFENSNLLPNVVYLIPQLTSTMDYEITLTTALDSLCHALDSLLNKNSNLDSVDYSINSIDLLSSNLKLSLDNLNNLEYRKNILYASNLSGRAINISRTSLNHAISYPITNYYGVPHGLACAFSVISTIEYFKNELLNFEFSNSIKLGEKLISQLNLSEFYIKYLSNLDVKLVSSKSLENVRSNNFIFDLNQNIVTEILNLSKKFYLTK